MNPRARTQGAGAGVSPQAGSGHSASNPQAGTPQPNSGQPQAGDDPQNDPSSSPNGDGQAQEEAMSLEEAQKLRRENQSLRSRLTATQQAAQQAAEERRAQELAAADAERLKAEITKLETQLRNEQEQYRRNAAEARIEVEATRLGLQPQLAVRLVNWDDITYDDQGKPTNVTEQLRELVKQFPTLRVNGAAASGQDAGVRGSRAQPGSNAEMNALLRQATGRGRR